MSAVSKRQELGLPQQPVVKITSNEGFHWDKPTLGGSPAPALISIPRWGLPNPPAPAPATVAWGEGAPPARPEWPVRTTHASPAEGRLPLDLAPTGLSPAPPPPSGCPGLWVRRVKASPSQPHWVRAHTRSCPLAVPPITTAVRSCVSSTAHTCGSQRAVLLPPALQAHPAHVRACTALSTLPSWPLQL